ncbi:ABC transporter permease [bacterium]|nr:ABC transporter permease [candidate division CSSED10-310 bacterium]
MMTARLALLRIFNLRPLVRDRVRGPLTFIGIALGVAALIAVTILNRATIDSFTASLDSLAGGADLVIAGDDSGVPEAVLDAVAEAPEVSAVVPVIERFVRVAGRLERPVLVVGVDTLADTAVRRYTAVDLELTDPLEFLAVPASVLIPVRLADALGVALEDTLDITTPGGIVTLTVRGLLTDRGAAAAYGGAVMFMDVFSLQKVFQLGDRFSRLDVVLAPGVTPESAAVRLGTLLAPPFKVQPPRSRGGEIIAMVATFRIGLTLVSALALFVAVFLIYNTFAVSLLRRRRQIGIQRCLGAGRMELFCRYLAEALLIGVIASAAGIFMGLWLARWMAPIAGRAVATLSAPPGELQFHLHRGDLLRGLLFGTFAAGAGALRPVWRAATVKPLEAVRRGLGRRRLARSYGCRALAGGALLLLVVPLAWFAPRLPSLASGAALCALTILGAVLLLPRLIVLVVKGWRRYRRSGGAAAFLATDALAENPGRAAVAVSSLMVGIAVVVAIACVLASFRFSILHWLDKEMKADMQVSAGSEFAGALNVPLDSGLEPELESVPGIEAVDKYRKLKITLNGLTTYVASLDMEEYLHYNELIYQEGGVEKARRECIGGNGLIASQSFAARHGLRMGDMVVLPTPKGPLAMAVSAVIIEYTSELGIAFIDTPLFNRYWDQDVVDIFLLHLAPGADRERVVAAIMERFAGRHELLVMKREALMESAMAFLEKTFSLTRAVEGAALLTALLAIMNTLYASVAERERELGVLRALGASRRQIYAIVLAEAVWVACLGLTAGTGLGLVLSGLLVKVVIPAMQGFTLVYRVAVRDMALVLFIAALASVAAGLPPARRAARTRIGAAVAYE